MRAVVVDASVMVDLLAKTELAALASAALAESELVAPALIDVEVLSALALMERAGALTTPDAQSAVDEWQQAAIERVAVPVLTPWAWARRLSIRISDAYYLAVADLLDIPLITSDGRLARAPHPGVEVMLIGE